MLTTTDKKYFIMTLRSKDILKKTCGKYIQETRKLLCFFKINTPALTHKNTMLWGYSKPPLLKPKKEYCTLD